jgi:hypothetical protein
MLTKNSTETTRIPESSNIVLEWRTFLGQESVRSKTVVHNKCLQQVKNFK